MTINKNKSAPKQAEKKVLKLITVAEFNKRMQERMDTTIEAAAQILLELVKELIFKQYNKESVPLGDVLSLEINTVDWSKSLPGKYTFDVPKNIARFITSDLSEEETILAASVFSRLAELLPGWKITKGRNHGSGSYRLVLFFSSNFKPAPIKEDSLK